MIKKALLRLGGAAAVVAVTASSAHALSFPYADSHVCGGNMFQTCASLKISFTGATATIQIRNLGPGIFTAFGFSHVPDGVTVVSSSIDAALCPNGNCRFTQGNQQDINGDVGFGSNAPPVHTGLQVNEGTGDGFTFTLTFSRVLNDKELAALDFGIHAQSGPNSCSTKLFIGADGGTSTTVDPACATTTVPEPMTMSLLATGLVGMGGMGAFKRRRRAA